MNPDFTGLPIPGPNQDPEEEPEELTDDKLVEAALDYEAQQRLWLRAIIPLLQLRSHDSDPSGRVQFAFDVMHIAACERVGRICRADLSAEGC